MTDRDDPAPISELLRRTILSAIEDGRTTFLALQRETGVQRSSIVRFCRGGQFLRLDMADRLAAHFGLELRPVKERRAQHG